MTVPDSSLLVLGIDPGSTAGLALWDSDAQRLVALASTHVLNVIGGLIRPVTERLDGGPLAPFLGAALVVVEDGSDLPIYSRHGAVRGGARDRLARRVGSTDARAADIAEAARRSGFHVAARPPAGHKWSDEELHRYTGWPLGKSNEHNRDAARLVVGMTAAEVRALLTAAGNGGETTRTDA